MPKRLPLIIGAFVLAVIILGLSLLLGPGPGRGVEANHGDETPSLEPADLPPGLQPDSLADTPPGQAGLINPEGDAGRGQVTRVEKDRTTVLTWAKIEPGRQGVYEVDSPTVAVKFHASPQSPATQGLTVTADQATLVAPEGTFRRGEFRHHVLVTLYRSPDGQPVALDDPDHARMRVRLAKNAAFDLELGKLTSDGPVHLVSRRVDFEGTGLTLKYNQLRHRIERLVIRKGKQLRFEMDEASEPAQQPQPSAGQAKAGPAQSGEGSDKASSPPKPDKAHGPQFYHARFSKQVRIQTHRGQSQGQAWDQAGRSNTSNASSPGRRGRSESASPGHGEPTRHSRPARQTGTARHSRAGGSPLASREPLANPLDSRLGGNDGLGPPDANDAGGREASNKPTQSIPEAEQRAGQTDLEMTGQSLDIVFALAPGASGQGGTSPRAEPEPATRSDQPAPTLNQEPMDAGTSNRSADQPSEAANPEDPWRQKQRPMGPADDLFAKANPNDVIIHWTGRLRLTPIRASKKPSDESDESAQSASPQSPHPSLAAPNDPDDLRMTINGSPKAPAKARTPRNQTLTGSRISYRTADQTLQVEAGPNRPLVLASPTVGRLEGQRLVLHRRTGQGYVLGPGRVEGKGPRGQGAKGPRGEEEEESRSDGGDGVIAWSERLDFAFYQGQGQGASSGGGQRQIAALRHARFRGDVQAHHEQMDLASDRMEIAFERDRDDPRQSHPTRLIANQHVKASKPGLRFRAGHLKAQLAAKSSSDTASDAPSNARSDAEPPPKAPNAGSSTAPPTDEADPGGMLGSAPTTVRRVNASNNVIVHLDKQQATIHADRLAARPGREMIELFGKADHPAVLRRPDGRLSGKRIVLNDKTGRVRVLGPGTFTHQSQPDAEDRTRSKLKVTWQRRMAFDNQARTAHFLGNVQANNQQQAQVNKVHQLNTNDLKLSFAAPDQQAAEPESSKPAVSNESSMTGTEEGTIGDLKKLTAREHVVFTAARLARAGPLSEREPNSNPNASLTQDIDADQWIEPGANIKPLRRIRLEGQSLTLTNSPAQPKPTTASKPEQAQRTKDLRVVGPGRMLIEDYRSDTQPNPDANANGSEQTPAPVTAAAPAAFTGHGATLFLWAGKLTMNEATNRMVMQDDVQMVHRPSNESGDESGPIQLDCQRLTAQLADQARHGSQGLTNEDQLEMPANSKIQTIRAQRAVRVTHAQQVIDCDLLRYIRQEQRVILTGEGRKIQAYENGKPASLAAHQLIWDLQNNRIEARQTTGGGALRGSR